MTKPNVRKVLKSVQTTLSKHSPEILTGIGIAGMFTTTVLAVKATPKALILIDEKKKAEGKDKLTPVETITTCWKPYIPAAVTGVVSTACIIGASSVSARRNAALATAYKLSETALSEYREKVIETVGEKKEQTIRDKVNQERVEKNPVSKSEVIITEKGNTLCYDSISGRYFKSDIDKIKAAVNELNYRMLNEMYVSLNEFYDELDLTHTKLGDELGWNLDGGKMEVYLGTSMADDDRTPCIVIDYRVAPKYDYSKLS